MRVIHANYFSEYQFILGWEKDGRWEFIENINGLHPIMGLPELGEAFNLFLEDFANGPEELAEFDYLRIIKSDDDDPLKFNTTRWRSVVQAFQVQLMGKQWGTCARVVFFGDEPKVRIMDDADGKLLAILYCGKPAYVGMDFRFFLPLMEQAKIPDMRLVDVSPRLRKLVKRVGNSDDLFRIFQEGLKT